MKASTTFVLITALLAGNALAQTSPEKGQPPAAKPGMGIMDMDARMAKMQEHMKTMQAQMASVHKTTDPAERRKLMQEHMQSMRDGMGMMHGMGGPMMGGKGGMGMGMMGGDPKQHQDMMERRMDMMHMMMDQMMQHQQMSQPAPAK